MASTRSLATTSSPSRSSHPRRSSAGQPAVRSTSAVGAAGSGSSAVRRNVIVRSSAFLLVRSVIKTTPFSLRSSPVISSTENVKAVPSVSIRKVPGSKNVFPAVSGWLDPPPLSGSGTMPVVTV